MPHYAASYVPLMRETEVLRWEPDSRRKPYALKVKDAFELLSKLEAGDHVWLMMGSTNAAVALTAFRKGVTVHQLSFSRASSLLVINGNKEPKQEEAASDQEQRSHGHRTKIQPSQILRVSQEAPQLFYPMSMGQAEALEIIATWQRVNDAMEARKAAANLVRTRIQQDALLYGKARGKDISTKEELEALLADLLDTKDEQNRKHVPGDPHIAFLAEQEEHERSRLRNLCRDSAFYLHLFDDVEGVGPNIGARFITGVERIERFKRPEDLSNYAGMLPRGKEGKLPSRKRSKGQTLSRDPILNSACWLLQDQMFQWGKKMPLGQILIQQVERECPCTPEQRKGDKELRRKHAQAVAEACIAMTRYFLEKIVWPKWREYIS